MRPFRAGLLAAVAVLLVAIGASAASADTTNAVPDVQYFDGRVFPPGVQGTIRITGTGWVNGTTFAFTPGAPAPTINIDNVAFANGDTQVTLLITPAADALGSFTLSATAPGEAATTVSTVIVRTPKGSFNPINPTRVLDTRLGTGGRLGALGPGESIAVHVTGIAGLVPANNVEAVTLNLTAVGPTSPGYLTVYPAGSPFPPVSNVNFAAGQTIPNHVMVGVGTDGNITVFNSDGNTHVIVDLVGWFGNELAPMGSGFVFAGTNPIRILDTRADVRIDAGNIRNLVIPNASKYLYVAAVMNVTVVNPGASGYLTAFPTGAALPNASTNNFVAGQTLPNLVTVKIGAASSVTFYNGSDAPIDLVVDIQGMWSPPVSIPGTVFKPNPGGPQRIYDSRVTPGRPIGPKGIIIATRPNVPGASSFVFNGTATGPTATGFVTVYPAVSALPGVSNLNFQPGQTVANQVVPGLMGTGNYAIYNDVGSTHVIIDVFGSLSLT
ncbi:MAG: hypothetical protein ABIQ73_17300 [Acidimicrobiales bacterium]